MPPSLKGRFPSLGEVSTPSNAPGESIIVEPQPGDAPASIIGESTPSVASIIGTAQVTPPAPVAGDGETILALESPWYVDQFDPSIEGCPVIPQAGVPVPDELVDQALSIGAANGVTIVKR